MNLTASDACMILNSLKGIGPVMARKLMRAFGGDPVKIFSCDKSILERLLAKRPQIYRSLLEYRQQFDLEAEQKRLYSLSGKYIGCTEAGYPPLLREIYDAPIGLYVLGEIDTRLKNIAVIGSRATSLSGLKLAHSIAMALAERGFCIVSGMAKGVDGAAHKGALAVGGATIAVVGNGVDVVYPSEHQKLYHEIVDCGAVISEFPLGTKPDSRNFPIRNRIIAGLVHAVIVVESDLRGGSMITAHMAGDYGRQVFAFPGKVDDTRCAGCLQLIREGAILVRNVEDILEDLPYLKTPEQMSLFGENLQGKVVNEEEGAQNRENVLSEPQDLMHDFDEDDEEIPLDPEEIRVLKVIQDASISDVDQLVNATNLDSTSVLHALQMLEIKGAVLRRYDGTFEIPR